MAPINGVARPNGHVPPPSSMLATHVRQGQGVPHLNQANFAQLLDESLGHDDNGQPNLNDDAEVNRKLVLVVVQLGIDPILSSERDDPFHSTRVLGKNIAQLKQCLAVLHLAIVRTRHVLFQSVEINTVLQEHTPLYIVILPKLLSLVCQSVDADIAKGVFDVLAAGIGADEQIKSDAGITIFSFLSYCLAGLTSCATRLQASLPQQQIQLEVSDFPTATSELQRSYIGPDQWFGSLPYQALLSVSSQLGVFLLRLRAPKQLRTQLAKHVAKLRFVGNSLSIGPHDSPVWNESFRTELGRSRLLPWSPHDPVEEQAADQEWSDSTRARKRVRLSWELQEENSTTNTREELTMQLTERLTGKAAPDFTNLHTTFPTRFKTLSDADQIASLDELGRAPCRAYLQSLNEALPCPVCDEPNLDIDGPDISDDVDELLRGLLSVKAVVQRRARLRLSALNTLRRVAAHATSAASLRLKGSNVGEWCLTSIRGSTRDVKILSARALQAFIKSAPGRDSTLMHENRVVALECLQAIWNDGDPGSLEAVVIALAQMAQVVEDEELNIILLRLVDYLGHHNPYITGVVYAELQQLGHSLQVTMATLFRPFWKTLSLTIVKNFAKRPEIAQQVSDLMGVQIEGLLQTIKEYALPYLVLHRDRKLIEQIGASSSSPMSPFDVCTEENHLSLILAFLLAQAFPDPERTIMELLLETSDDFREQDLMVLVNHDPVSIACELLESIGDVGQGKASRTYQGLQLLAQLSTRRTGHGSASRRTDKTAAFLENNALAIVTRLTVKFNGTTKRETNVEKRRCLIALGEIMTLGKGRIKVALPQICACLRVAMDDPLMCNASFSAWNAMMTSLEEDDIRDLISQTFAIIVRSWAHFNTKVQEQAYNLVAMLLKEHEALIRDVFEDLPSLALIPLMVKFDNELTTLKRQKDDRNQLAAFVSRLQDENVAVVQQALEELVNVLREKHDFMQKSILREQPEELVEGLCRAILDSCTKFSSTQNLVLLGVQCLGAIGCIDPSRIESIREMKKFVLASNFTNLDETIAFLMFFMERVLVDEYVSTSNLREKGFLAWSLQQLLVYCELSPDITTRGRLGGLTSKDKYWFDLSETTRLVLTPFLTSRFVSGAKRQKAEITYPFFKAGMTYKHWLTELTLNLLNRASSEYVEAIFDVCGRLVVHGLGTAIPSFLLPYIALHLLLSGTEKDKQDLMAEISCVLQQSMENLEITDQDHVRQCSQAIFDVLDYMSVWLQEMRKKTAQAKVRAERGIRDPVLDFGPQQIELVAPVLMSVPPKAITQRAIECRSFFRALFHQEQHINTLQDVSDLEYRRLQDIYAQIDEPDGIEGISAQIKLLDVEAEVMEHKKAGRWNTAQSWYEMKLMEHPDDVEVQVNLLKCLKESGQYDVLINHFDAMTSKIDRPNLSLMPYAIEAAWVTNRWDKLSRYIVDGPKGDFAVKLGEIMLSALNDNRKSASAQLQEAFLTVSADLTPNATSSFQACHEPLLKMHVLDDVRMMIESPPDDRNTTLNNINKRLPILGSYVADKQYLLGIQRAVMSIKSTVFHRDDLASSWLTSARLARKAGATSQAFNAVLRASSLGDKTAAIEQAKLMWQEGHHRKAIQTLEGAIESGAFTPHTYRADVESMTVDSGPEDRNDMTARAFVLLGKWLDQAGQTQSDTIIKTFRKSTEQNRRWEKGWYNLGRHYNRILESEKSKPPGKENQSFLTGETAKLVIDNFLRALATGHKYLFQTLPKVLTLWLELVGNENQEHNTGNQDHSAGNQKHDARRGNTEFHMHTAKQRKKTIDDTNGSVKKYVDRITPYALYTILPQLVARICHKDQTVHGILQLMIIKVIRAFPQQALWTVLATAKSSSKDRATRGLGLLRKTVENMKKDPRGWSQGEMREFILAGQKFSDALLDVANFDIQGRVTNVKLSKDLGFNHKIAPSKLVVPCEACLTPNIPTDNDIGSKTFRAFAKEPITISAFLDEAKVLPSLQKPRKLMLRGSDGRIYSVLAKPHDDLRKDQRLMEFDTMINRFLKRDINASKRRLYIRTYAVVPLNEECGLIEWVDGLKTMRDILLELYRQRGVVADYSAIREQLDQICARSDNKAQDFFDKVQSRFPVVLRHWFIETFPDSTTWFNARLRYARTTAVMSMVGHVLGLGDRHGENILFEQGNGGILHVDFNCLFDKGLTFEKPEMVPFRLTHNMIDAFGPYKLDGPYRRSCEVTLTLLRSNEDALMTILETFLYDPTTDFMTAGKKRKTKASYVAGEVPDTPERMLEGVRGKVRGMLAGESVPLSVGGYVEEMIKRASDGSNLARMYIGWCAFF